MTPINGVRIFTIILAIVFAFAGYATSTTPHAGGIGSAASTTYASGIGTAASTSR